VIVQAEPLLDEQGVPRGAIAAVVDISERKKAESTRIRLMHELRHRVKNILATVAALAARMLASGTSLDEFAAAFQRRLLAMGRLHELLSEGPCEGAGLGTLASVVLASYVNYGNDNVELSDAAVVLQPNEAVTLGLVLTKLASNAAKYGALSVPAGRAELAWTVRDEAGKKWLSLAWKERTGPRIETFPSMEFGTRFNTQSIDYELEGVAKLTFRPDGLRCEIEFPLRDNRTETIEREISRQAEELPHGVPKPTAAWPEGPDRRGRLSRGYGLLRSIGAARLHRSRAAARLGLAL